MFRHYTVRRKLGVTFALLVLAFLVAHPIDLRAQAPVVGGGNPLLNAPFGAIPPGSYPASQGPSGLTDLGNGMALGRSSKNDVSPLLRDIPPMPVKSRSPREENENPSVPVAHKDVPDTVVQKFMAPFAMPTPTLNFDGIPFP